MCVREVSQYKGPEMGHKCNSALHQDNTHARIFVSAGAESSRCRWCSVYLRTLLGRLPSWAAALAAVHHCKRWLFFLENDGGLIQNQVTAVTEHLDHTSIPYDCREINLIMWKYVSNFMHIYVFTSCWLDPLDSDELLQLFNSDKRKSRKRIK